jgi:hypothetical protein
MDQHTITIPYTAGGAQETVGIVEFHNTQPRLIETARQPAPFPTGYALAIVREGTLPAHLIYRLPLGMTTGATWKPEHNQQIEDALPVLTTGREQAFTTNEQQERQQLWQQVLVRQSALLIQGLFCPGGTWQTCSLYWVRAAATLVRRVLTWYEHTRVPYDRYHRRNEMFLWRLYTHILLRLEHLRLEDTTQRWSDDQTDVLEDAITRWLTICQDEQAAWLFYQAVSPESDPLNTVTRSGLAYREHRREQEVDSVVAQMKLLIGMCERQPPAKRQSDHLERLLRDQLELIGLTWYLPRYRIGDGRQAIAISRGYTRWHEQWVHVPLGWSRLLAGILVGFFVFVLENGVWEMADTLVQHPLRLGIGILVPASITWYYLASGIQRKVAYDAGKRTWHLWIIGQISAIGMALLFSWLLQPTIQWSEPWHAWVAPVLLAQFALFIGIFTQLIFDEKPTTTPLDAP